MGFYFRKSVNFGPVRFNFSKSGLGMSVGVKGARISTGPRGTYIHAGSHGFYYRQRLDTPNSQAPREVRWDSQTHAPRLDAYRIETADVSQFGDVSSENLLQQINACAQHMRYAPLVLIATLLATLITTDLVFFVFHAYVNAFISRLIVDHEWANTIIPFTECVLSGIPLLVGLVWADKIRKEDIVRRTTPLFYALEENALAHFTAVQKSCETLARSMRLWRVETKQSTFDWKRNAGASSLITRKAIHIGQLQPPCIVTNVDVWGMSLNDQTLFFFPDRIFVRQGERYGTIPYESLVISFMPTRFIEDDGVPGDAHVVDHTWQYVNKNGGPDRRFSHNRQLPIAQYGFIELKSHTGLNLHVHASNLQAAASFVDTFIRIIGVQGAQQQWQESPRQEPPCSEEKKRPRSEKAKPATRKRPAYQVLGIPLGASPEAIATAYHHMAKMYHPDKLAHLAPEFVALAEEWVLIR